MGVLNGFKFKPKKEKFPYIGYFVGKEDKKRWWRVKWGIEGKERKRGEAGRRQPSQATIYLSGAWGLILGKRKEWVAEAGKMPCLNISTNVSLDGVDTSAILSQATSTVAKIISKPEAVLFFYFFLLCFLFSPFSFFKIYTSTSFHLPISDYSINPFLQKILDLLEVIMFMFLFVNA